MITCAFTPLQTYCLRLGDSSLILSHRLAEWCGHAPELELDLALSNIALDLLGQARHFLSYAAEQSSHELDEDRLVAQRHERQFYNLLLTEQPGECFSETLVRQFFMDAYHLPLYQALSQSQDAQLAAIAAKSCKEVRYHLRFSRGWMIRLGDGTAFSQQKMQSAVERLWRFTGELFHADVLELALVEQGIAVDPRTLQAVWLQEVQEVLQLGSLQMPTEEAYRRGGKQGLHTEHLGYILADMQYVQRAYPNNRW